MTTYNHIAGEEKDDFHDNNKIITINNSINVTNPPQRINTKALNGLRGIIAFHIMVHHSFEFSKFKQNLLGSVQMPLFFLISGFILALNDGKILYSLTKCCTELQKYTETHKNENKFNGRNFYQRRIARTIPIYYLTSFAAIPLVFIGYSTFITPGLFVYITIILTIFTVPVWFGPFFFNPTAWFVSTIWFFYWVFPSLLPKLQRYSISKKQHWILYYYILQFIIGACIYIGLLFVPVFNDFAFNIATMWPPSRLPIFIMGILAGLLRNENITIKASQSDFTEDNWSRKCNFLGIMTNLILIPCVVIDRLTNNMTNFSIWLQLFIAWWQLQFIYALTMDNGISLISKILSSKMMLQLGRISYSLYLTHFPIMGYICWYLYGTQSQPICEWDSSDECNHKWNIYYDNKLIPIWAIPIHMCLSFIVAIILNRLFEEPMRNWLRPKKIETKSSVNGEIESEIYGTMK
eukprot:547981_1